MDTMKNTDTQAAYREGRQTGMALSALALSIVSFISLLGLEKAILALVLGALVLREAQGGSPARRKATTAVVVASVYAVFFFVTLAVFHDKIAVLIRTLQQMS
jgi:hypothetical protein